MNDDIARTLGSRMHAAFNALDLDAVHEIFAPDFFSHPLQVTGPDAVAERWSAMREAAPDLRTELLDVIADGDRVALRSRLSDGSGELFEILRIADGKIAQLRGARAG
jgi:ketosteroid isomerase-like protein